MAGVNQKASEQWRVGQRISVRGQLWTILERTGFADCEALRLSGAGGSPLQSIRTILLPFDRPRRLPEPSSIAVLRPQRWLRELYRTLLGAQPFGSLSAAVSSTIEFLPYQLEPALAMLRDGCTRMLIADGVGLGKTIQAGLILNELAVRLGSFRGLVLAPAGLREQWAAELAARFGIDSVLAGSPWLARTASGLPPDVNPWALPGVYIASLDFIKQPEVLRPFEEVEWDALVVDEAHAAAPGTARHDAVHAIARRSRRVILLSATPHGGAPEQFRALCRIGDWEGNPQPVLIFRRTREDTGATRPRRTTLLPVRLSDSERRMHRLLEAYTSRVCAESRVRGDMQARLAAVVLRKRALSSAASLEISCRRRLAILTAGIDGPTERQLTLPLDEEDPLEDDEPVSVLGAPGLADSAHEQRWLTSLIEAACDAAHHESKIRRLAKLLRRMNEPALVFTEYRDTLERLRAAFAGSHPDLVVLHGGMSLPERSVAQHAFNAGGSLLLATDAASEGLNLHRRCRTVIHFELPWNPGRLEQRTGRVDRIGQARVVHEILLVADDTAERLVLAPLVRRAARARRALPGRSALCDALTESRVAAAVMDAAPLELADAEVDIVVAAPRADSDLEAVEEASRLTEHRTWRRRASRRDLRQGVAVSVLRTKHVSLPNGIICVFSLSLLGDDGNVHHRETVIVHEPWRIPDVPRTPSAVRDIVGAFRAARIASLETAILERASGRIAAITARLDAATAVTAARERSISASVAPARDLVQAGLFDQRALRSSAARLRATSSLLSDAEWRLDRLASATDLTPVVSLSEILIVTGHRHA